MTRPAHQGEPTSWARRTFASLGNPNYAKFFTGYALSFTGTWMQSVALAWLVLQLTDSPALLGVVIALKPSSGAVSLPALGALTGALMFALMNVTGRLLRGPQSPGELKTRTERLHGFPD